MITRLKTKKSFLFLLLSLILFICVLIVFSNKFVVNAQFNIERFEDEYFVGDTLEVPHGSVIVNGEQKDAKFEIITPSGFVSSTCKFALNEYGEYSVRYFYNDGIKFYEKIVNIVAERPLFEIVGRGSFEYGNHEYLTYIDPDTNVKTEYGGLITSLASGGKLLYNKIINLSKLSKTEPIVSYTITPDEIGKPDFRGLNLKLVDIYNPDNYLVFINTDHEAGDFAYVSYGFVGINSEYVKYTFSSVDTDKYGIGSVFTFNGTPGAEGPTIYHPDKTDYYKDKMNWYIDYANQDVYLRSEHVEAPSLVCNLDETGAWNGFTTGEVRLEIYASNYVESYANFVVRSVTGANLEDKKVKDDIAPEISIDFGEYTKDILPNAKVGCSYKIFTATAADNLDGKVKTKVFVYRNYYTNKRILVNVSDDLFYPTEQGVYTICYVAKDNFGNESVKTVDISALREERPIKINRLNTVSVGKQGEAIPIADFMVKGGFGNLSTSVSVKFDGSEVAVKGNSFVPMFTGTYKVSITAEDYVGQVRIDNYDVNVDANDKPVLLEDFENQLDKYYVVGYGYKLPEVKMCVFKKDGKSFEMITCALTVDNGEIINGVYFPDTVGVVNFTYSAEIGAEKTQVTKTRQVCSIQNGKKLDVNKLFITGESVTADYDDYYNPRYFFTEDNKIDFVNSLIAEGFSIKFHTEEFRNNIEYVDFKLTDIHNVEETVTFRIIKAGANLFLKVNGVSAPIQLATSFASVEDTFFSFKASSGLLTIASNNVKVDKYFSGEPYKGFSSDKINLSISTKNVGIGGFAIIVKEINGMTLTSRNSSDNRRPSLYEIGDTTRTMRIGEQYTLQKVIAGDVISPYLKSFTVTVKNPDGSFATSIDGVVLNNAPVDRYQFTLDLFGTYSIFYSATDYADNEGQLTPTIQVLDFVPPVASISEDRVTKAKLGDTVKVASLKDIEDNYGEVLSEGVSVFIKTPITNKITMVDGSFTAEEKGQYTVYYYIVDCSQDGVSQGNTTVLSYTVSVS